MTHLSKNEIIRMRIKRIEKEIRDTPYHKKTERHIGILRAKLSKLKDEAEGSKAKKGGGTGYAVKKQGDATITLVGSPSVGKSTLLNTLTNAKSKIAPYAFTTVKVIPGMMKLNDAYIQILDVPGLIEGAEKGKGRGREVLSVIRSSNLIIIITEVNDIKSISQIKKTLESNGIRINQQKPEVSIDKKLKGGIIIHSNIKQPFSNQTIKDVASEMGIKNAEITIKQKLTLDKLVDCFSKNIVYIKAIYVVNKTDLSKNIDNDKNYIYISAEKGTNIKILKQQIWNQLDLIRVYLVKRNEKPSKNSPLIVKRNITLKEISVKIGEEFSENVKSALIWGPGSRYDGQEVSLSKIAIDEVQIRFI